ncbi:MAG: hypothetical protein C0483_10910 [Pirellula sp.]|nr:hypothetical protein [Pirellula sp.]
MILIPISRCAFLLTMLILLQTQLQHAAAAEPAPSRAVVDETWNGAFTRSAGWNGGDVAGTVDLGDGRTLWLFGDTLYGQVQEGKRVAGNVMFNNSVALQGTNDSRSLEFVTGKLDEKGKPTALFPPTRAADAEVNQHWEADEEYWPTGGGCAVAVDGKRRLYVGLFRIRKPKQGGGTWGFRHVGNSLGVVDDVSRPPAEWKTRVVALPMSVGDGVTEKQSVAPPTSYSFGEVFLPYTRGDEPGFLIYGVRAPKQKRRQLIAAFAPRDALDDFARWQYFAGPDRWSSAVADAATLCDDIAPEFSIEPLRTQSPTPFDGFVLVQNEPLLGPGILVRTAPSPLGPWSTPREVFRPKEPAGDKDLFSYAAKGHAALSPDGELLISYIVSAHDFWRLFREAGLYRPRFVRVPLEAVLPK